MNTQISAQIGKAPLALDEVSSRSSSSMERVLLLLLATVTFGLTMWGLQRLLPYTPDFDESIFVDASLRVALSTDGNPGWFGNPGSTTIYPLAGVALLWHGLSHLGDSTPGTPPLESHFAANWWEYYYLGRYVSLVYHLMAVLVLFQVGKRAFHRWIGLGGAWIYALTLMVIFYAKMVRTDTAATFYALLALYACLRILQSPSVRWQLLAGALIGLAVASRYFLIVLAPVLLLTNFWCWWQWRRSWRARMTAGVVAGVVMIPLCFFLTTPYFFLDFATALENLRLEARTTHPGADGLTPIGNLIWYTTTAFPTISSSAQVLTVMLGVIALVRSPRPGPFLLLAYCVFFLLAISTSALHWDRWLIPILPCLALFSAYGINSLASFAQSIQHRWLAPTGSTEAHIYAAGVIMLSAWLAFASVSHVIKQGNTSTPLQARAWVLANLPPSARILQEGYSVPLSGTPFHTDQVFSIALDRRGNQAATGVPGDAYPYVVVNSSVFNRFFAQPERYTEEVSVYTRLFTQARLVKRFEPDRWTDGPIIEIYALPEHP